MWLNSVDHIFRLLRSSPLSLLMVAVRHRTVIANGALLFKHNHAVIYLHSGVVLALTIKAPALVSNNNNARQEDKRDARTFSSFFSMRSALSVFFSRFRADFPVSNECGTIATIVVSCVCMHSLVSKPTAVTHSPASRDVDRTVVYWMHYNRPGELCAVFVYVISTRASHNPAYPLLRPSREEWDRRWRERQQR